MKFCTILFMHGILLVSKHADVATAGGEEKEKIVVHAKVNTNAIIPCNIEILTTEPDAVLTITWNKKSETSLFLASAQTDNGTLSVTYLTESLQTKYQIKQDYELEILDVKMQDTSDYTCQVIKFLDETRGAIDERFQNTTSLLVQDVPSVPGRPLMSNLQSRSVSVSWDKSLSENNSPITGYIVQVRRLSDEWSSARNITVGTPTTTINVIDLRPYRSYVLRIIAINSCGQSPPSGASDIFVTPSEGMLFNSISVPLVRPYTEYFVSVKAVNDAGAGPEAVTYVITAEGSKYNIN
ncbi:hypothetical protein KUTeg_020211 [Tegillarca granosa]|uniref:Uncharacterized protein n=1 Tax=Tegillarca granosa TaxID=220873 RepID=A0ABQ9E795_TEGGR|nr:hypothetical protein KUTeg_020211 [Tegillarca granosa]